MGRTNFELPRHLAKHANGSRAVLGAIDVFEQVMNEHQRLYGPPVQPALATERRSLLALLGERSRYLELSALVADLLVLPFILPIPPEYRLDIR